jgi:hypothetical protein
VFVPDISRIARRRRVVADREKKGRDIMIAAGGERAMRIREIASMSAPDPPEEEDGCTN